MACDSAVCPPHCNRAHPGHRPAQAFLPKPQPLLPVLLNGQESGEVDQLADPILRKTLQNGLETGECADDVELSG